MSNNTASNTTETTSQSNTSTTLSSTSLKTSQSTTQGTILTTNSEATSVLSTAASVNTTIPITSSITNARSTAQISTTDQLSTDASTTFYTSTNSDAFISVSSFDQSTEYIANPTTVATEATSAEFSSPGNSTTTVLAVTIPLLAIIILLLVVILCYRKGMLCSQSHDDEENPLDEGMSLKASKRRSMHNKLKYAVGKMAISRENFYLEYHKKSADDNRMFRMEFLALPDEMQDRNVGMKPSNTSKNRYDNIIPYDATRVLLEPKDNDPQSDYINANFVSGYRYKKKWIATQGAMEETFTDFWQMIWEQKTYIIIMLTNLVENTRPKCNQYWPGSDAGGKVIEKYGDYTVTMLDVQKRNFYIVRTFFLEHNDEPKRTIKQFHYVAWPDFGVPTNASHILQFRHRIIAATPAHSGPIVIHCSAGVGRTGTYIVIDAGIEQIEAENQVDVFSFLNEIRSERIKLVQTDMQYAFAHKAIMEHIRFGVTELSIKELKKKVKILGEKANQDETFLEIEFQKLLKLPLQKDFLTSGRQSIKKNRVLQIIPYDFNRVVLPRKPGVDKSEYINASYIDGFYGKASFIATQGPLENTTEDFWIMVWENKVMNIIMLTRLEEKGHVVCEKYWPDNVEESKVFGEITIKLVNQDTSLIEDCVIRKFAIKYAQRNVDERIVQHFHYTGWPDVGRGCPSNSQSLFEIIAKAKADSISSPPIIVHCSSGGGRTGVLCCLANLVEQAQNDGVIDVFETARYLREQRPHMIQTEDQLYFCYISMLEYTESNIIDESDESLSNFSDNNEQETEIENESGLNSQGNNQDSPVSDKAQSPCELESNEQTVV